VKELEYRESPVRVERHERRRKIERLACDVTQL